MKKDQYVEGLNMVQFKNLPEISHYNSNYYVGFGKDLLYAQSNDDNITEWWIIIGGDKQYLGESYTSEGDILHRHDQPLT